ncbi:MAG: UDP-N-acetylglucosamine 1-carboxyvinyltransferase, partial [Candidatus Falkowbacteria bacterium]|nr:UDP-N-acetylglucosamine 1-carboxyvinyltransferase [Candidatus Falkowbacteria bacterium]
MSKLIIEGPTKLSGEINVKGAKNSALKIIPTAILSKEPIRITNLPLVEDIEKSLSLLADLGAEVKRAKDTVEIDPSGINKTELNPVIANKFRASIMFVGPLLARFGQVKFFHPGGCVIGAGGRPIDLFIDGFSSLGAEVKYNEDESYLLTAKQLVGNHYFFNVISVTATEALIMTAVLAKG